MRTIIISALAIFWVSVLVILGYGINFQKSNNLAGMAPISPFGFLGQNQAGNAEEGFEAQSENRNLTLDGAQSNEATNPGFSSNLLSLNEVAKHSSQNDCWMVVGKGVYDFTKYLPLHPGGPETMIPYCGKDASLAFSTKDKNPARPHSKAAEALLSEYYVGALGQTLAANAPQKKLSQNSSVQQLVKKIVPIAKAAQPQTAPIPTPAPRQDFVPFQTPAQTPLSSPAPFVTPSQNLNLSQFSPSVISQHNSASSCWMIVSGKVYDVTSYLPRHPGGIGAILPYCGKDGSADFFGLPHSVRAENILASYYIGDVNSLSNESPLPSPLPSPSQSPSPIQTPVLTPTNSPVPTPAPTLNPIPTPTPTPISTPPPQSPTNPLFSPSVISQHNSASSCWMIVSGKVYDVTSYLPRHPGGIGAILPYCGKDGSAAFFGLPHSVRAENILASYYIGDVGINSPTPTSTPTPTPTLVPSPSPSVFPLPSPTASPSPFPPREEEDDD